MVEFNKLTGEKKKVTPPYNIKDSAQRKNWQVGGDDVVPFPFKLMPETYTYIASDINNNLINN